ncbi:hypothetical protein PAXINDRAFT_19238 [Paxillus involutus ATCC 200175]|uniref:Protein kinase domain-containing protein n=1 Tax=Paxillus involutus ATCC 200175 TaxID=664439 RepID=A0A0C9TJT3_PAXIN|nr:hypothetical protein PAXINDRAFT_19238 [Paxillus involutus ATCC 200175]
MAISSSGEFKFMRIDLSLIPQDLTGQIVGTEHYPTAIGTFSDIWKGVYIFQHRELTVAVKTIRRHRDDQPVNTKSLHDQVGRWKTLSHKNVLPVYGTLNIGLLPSLVCPWVDGGSLTHYIDLHSNLSHEQRHEILLQICDGLCYLHAKEIVHGELNGGSVLMDTKGNAYLADFGLLPIVLELRTALSLSTAIGSSVRWAAPELFEVSESTNGPPLQLSLQSDIYSFGSIMLQVGHRAIWRVAQLILAQVLSGDIPYHTIKGDNQVLYVIAKAIKPDRPQTPNVTDEYWEFIQRCWSSRRENKRPSATDVSTFLVATSTQIGSTFQNYDYAHSTALENPTQDDVWNLVDIRREFPSDLTGYVRREDEHPVASGSYGDVYRATFRVRRRSLDVAVKAIRTYSVDDGDCAQKKKRFRREIRVWLTLHHINVLPLFGTTMGFGRFPAMVSPWLENGPLTTYLERRTDTLTTVERLVLVGDVAMGLQYLHSKSVVHGDLSGSNVLICANGRACIADFGRSTLLTALESTTATTSPAGGTLRWTAPELLYLNIEVSGDEEIMPRVLPTPPSDIYSFGAIMLQVLTGKIPYHYYPRDERVLFALSQGEIPKRPARTLVTDKEWSFIQWCWTPADARPSDEDIVEFTQNELA